MTPAHHIAVIKLNYKWRDYPWQKQAMQCPVLKPSSLVKLSSLEQEWHRFLGAVRFCAHSN